MTDSHVVEYWDHGYAGWRRIDTYGDAPKAEFTDRRKARAVARETARYYSNGVRIRSTIDGVERITTVQPKREAGWR